MAKSRLEKGLQGITWIVGVFAQSFPAISYFFDFAPPFFPPLGAFVSVLGVTILCWANVREKGSASKGPRRAAGFIVCALMLITAYGVALNYLSVTPPAGHTGKRMQIGFYMARWSLTANAIELIDRMAKRSPPIDLDTPTDLMGAYGVWGGAGRTDEIWTLWSVIAAGAILTFGFITSFSVWAYGIGILISYLTTRSTGRR